MLELQPKGAGQPGPQIVMAAPGQVRLTAQVRAHPAYYELISMRRRLAVILTVAMLAIYFGFVFLVAWAPGVMGTHITRSITLGFLLGLGVILSAIVLTGIYVLRANSTFDALTRRIVGDAP
jgi:uncharacterized membrane protein (DUF485 family)